MRSLKFLILIIAVFILVSASATTPTAYDVSFADHYGIAQQDCSTLESNNFVVHPDLLLNKHKCGRCVNPDPNVSPTPCDCWANIGVSGCTSTIMNSALGSSFASIWNNDRDTDYNALPLQKYVDWEKCIAGILPRSQCTITIDNDNMLAGGQVKFMLQAFTLLFPKAGLTFNSFRVKFGKYTFIGENHQDTIQFSWVHMDRHNTDSALNTYSMSYHYVESALRYNSFNHEWYEQSIPYSYGQERERSSWMAPEIDGVTFKFHHFGANGGYYGFYDNCQSSNPSQCIKWGWENRNNAWEDGQELSIGYGLKIVEYPDETKVIWPNNICTRTEPCNNMRCIPSGVHFPAGDDTSYTCDCEGFGSGTNCETKNTCMFEVGSKRQHCYREGTSSCSSTSNGLGDDFTCNCKTGWRGRICADKLPCNDLSKCNTEHATCTPGATDDDFTCVCDEFWSGTTCAVEPLCTGVWNVDQTTSSECSYAGYCENKPSIPNSNNRGAIAQRECHCVFGALGASCQYSSICSTANPCQNGGTCKDYEDGVVDNLSIPQTCSCPSGKVGSNCEYDIACKNSNPCLNDGECVVGNPKHIAVCKCKNFYSGPTCAIDPPCSSVACQNGGKCSNTDNGKCICPNGFKGEFCEIAETTKCNNPSNPHKCENGSNCVISSTVNRGYKCVCAEGYMGNNCQKTWCEHLNNPCNNGGTCSNVPNGRRKFTCDCEGTGFMGFKCHNEKKACSQPANKDKCKNGGECFPESNVKASCKCAEGYFGATCEEAARKVKKTELAPVVRQFFDDKNIDVSKVVYDAKKFPHLTAEAVRETSISIITFYSMPSGIGATGWSGKKMRAFTAKVMTMANTNKAAVTSINPIMTIVAKGNWSKNYDKNNPGRRLFSGTSNMVDEIEITFTANSTYDDDIISVSAFLESGNQTDQNYLAEELNNDPNYDDSPLLIPEEIVADVDEDSTEILIIDYVQDADNFTDEEIATYEPPQPPTPAPTAAHTEAPAVVSTSKEPVTQRAKADNVVGGGKGTPKPTNAQRKAGEAKYKKPAAYTGASKTKEEVKQIIKDYFAANPSRASWDSSKKIAFIKKMKAKYMS